MSKEALLIYKKAGISEESDWAQGTVTDATKLLPLRDSGVIIGLAPNVIQPVRLTGRAGQQQTILGTFSPSLTVPAFGYPVGCGLKLLKAALGQVTSTEQASFIVAATNKKIDFKEDGGGELTATIEEGTFPAGTSGATAGTLCAKIKAALEAAGSGTYTVTYSYTTKKFTIAVSGGASAVQFLFATGTNVATCAASLLGFAAADTASQASHTTDTATEIVFQHVISILDAIQYGLTKGLTIQAKLADATVFDILDCVVNALNVSYAPNQELHFDAEVQARKVEASSADLAALTSPAVNPVLYSQAVFTLNGSPVTLSSLGISFNNNLKTDLFGNSQYRTRFVRGGLRAVTGNLTFDITDSAVFDLYDAFKADSAGVPLVATFTSGSTIKGSAKYSIAMNLPLIKWNFDSVPGGGGTDAPAGDCPFIALDDGTNGELYFTIQNNEATV